MALSIAIDEQSLINIITKLPLPFEMKQFWLEPGRCFSMKVELDGKDVKVKIAPFVTNGKLELKIIKVFAEGINIDVSSLVPMFTGKIENALSLEMKKFIDIDGNSIYINLPIQYVGISQTKVFIMRF